MALLKTDKKKAAADKQKAKVARAKEKAAKAREKAAKARAKEKAAKAREKAKAALIKGIIRRPSNCELCNSIDTPLRDGRSGLRMDHYKGYGEENWINVKFICLECDGKQLRKDYDYIHGM